MDAIELMMEEHKNIKVMLKIVRKACYSILEGKVVKYGMLVEHDLGRLYITSLSEALENFKKGNNEAKLDIIANAVAYTNLLERHIHKEDNIIYKFTQRELKDDTIKLINKECNEFEDEFLNIKDENLSILEELKNKYCL